MPHTKSAKKALRQTAKRYARNKATKKTIKFQIKKFLAVLDKGTPEQKNAEFVLTVKKLDKAAAKGILHRNMVARKKSQLALKLTKANAVVPAAPASV